MKNRYRFGIGLTLLAILTGIVIWQGSFSVGDLAPTTPEQVYVFWGLSSVTFLLTVLLAFILFRDAMKLYFQRRAGVEGSRIRTKIVVGALFLTFLPTIFLVLWSVEVLNRTLAKWFSRPAVEITRNLGEIAGAMEKDSRARAESLARWVADSEPVRQYARTGQTPSEFFAAVCRGNQVEEAHIRRKDGGQIAICEAERPDAGTAGAASWERLGKEVTAEAPIGDEGWVVVVRTRMPLELAKYQAEIERQIRDYDRLEQSRKSTRRFYLQLLLLITLFILFFATWVALFLARQISAPVTALLDAARAVRAGNLAYRVKVGATDEFAVLVRAFNEMTQDLETSREELEQRRRFIEAVLENIPTGVLLLHPDGRIRLMNRAVGEILPDAREKTPERLSDVIPAEQQSDFSRLLKRAARLGVASRQVEMRSAGAERHLSVTVSALGEKTFPAYNPGGYVMVIEDTSELLRAQRAAAWHEVARRIAHELKNPLTPIALSSERILRQMERTPAPPEVRRIVADCCATIAREIESVKTLVDEFSQFARWPQATPAPADMNDVVNDALAVFAGRLDGIDIRLALAPNLPMVMLDREQFKRVVVNLVDNAAEAMRDAPLRRLFIGTAAPTAESVELTIADTGCGISQEDKEKLFLPYFSTKQRGTGLGLAIVSHIVGEHNGQIRVEDNQPAGARFIIEMAAMGSVEAEVKPTAESVQ